MYIGKYKINKAGRGLKLSIPSYVAKNTRMEANSDVHVYLLKGAMIVSDKKAFRCNRCAYRCMRTPAEDEHGDVFPCCNDSRRGATMMFGQRCILCILRETGS